MRPKKKQLPPSLQPFSDLITAQSIDDLYDVQFLLAEGSMGKVYSAKLKGAPEKVHAIKVVHAAIASPQDEGEDELAELCAEVRILRAVAKVEWVTTLHGAYYANEKLSIVMELADGGGLGDMLEGLKRTLTEEEARLVGLGMVRGLAALHKMGVIHRDIKSDNVLVTSQGHVKLTDFGVAYHRSTGFGLGSGQVLAKDHLLVGSPYWIAPEVVNVRPGRPYDAKVDMWSTGITLIELVEGRPPRYDLEPMQVMATIVEEDPPTLTNPSAFSDAFVAFVGACLTKHAAHRLGSKEALKADLFTSGSTDFAPVAAMTTEFQEACKALLPQPRKVTEMEKEALKDRLARKFGARPGTEVLNVEVVEKAQELYQEKVAARNDQELLEEAVKPSAAGKSKATKLLGLDDHVRASLGLDASESLAVRTDNAKSRRFGEGLFKSDRYKKNARMRLFISKT
jgi:serine/threonine-protein kinase 24/25/MST4